MSAENRLKKIICTPQGWFIWRASMMALLFLGFGSYFCYDAIFGYPEKNKIYFTYQVFEKAGEQFAQYSMEDRAGDWANYAQNQVIEAQPLYAGVVSTPWPKELGDIVLMKSGWNKAWLSYTERTRQAVTPPEKPYDEGKIFEQWMAAGICGVLCLTALFFLFRTLNRRMIWESGILWLQGEKIAIKDIILLDMRSWKLKGIATVRTSSRKYRIDGLTYGGFSTENTQNAQQLMDALLSEYEGEVMDYE